MDNDWQTRQVIKPVSGLKHQNANDEEYWWYGGMVALKLSAAVSCWLNTQKNKHIALNEKKREKNRIALKKTNTVLN